MQSSELRAQSVCLFIIATMCVATSLIFLRSMMIPFVISIFLFLLLTPLLRYLRISLNLGQVTSLAITFLGVSCITLILVLFGVYSVQNVLFDTEIYQSKLNDFLPKIQEMLNDSPLAAKLDIKSIQAQLDQLPLWGIAQSLASSFAKILSNALIIVIFLLFLLAGYIPTSEKSPVYEEITAKIQRYITTKLLTSLVTALCVGTIYNFLGMDLAFTFGLVAFLLNFIPSLGSIVATLIPLPIAFLQFGFTSPFWICLSIPSAIQITIGNIIEPKMMGDSLGLHPVSILTALMFWGAIWGFTGMFLAVPMTSCLQIVMEQIPLTRPLASILSGKFDNLLPVYTTEENS
ncbi:MAG: AI-2E family transporter [Oligoflexales bacterium]